MKFYIAGKITGLVYEDAQKAFAEAEQALTKLGHESVNPMRENGLDGDGKEYPWAEYMKRDIPLLLKCDGIYLLKNWRNSRGAFLEKHIAVSIGMLRIYEADSAMYGSCVRCGKEIPFMRADDTPECSSCYRQRNSISNVSGVGIMTHAKV